MSAKRPRISLLLLWALAAIATVTIPAFSATITSLEPPSVVAGSADFTLIVNGTGFAPTDVVNWNGTALPTSFVSATQLQATVSSGLLLSSGTVNINVSAFANALIFTQSGTWGTDVPTTTFSAPNQSWSFSFSLSGTPVAEFPGSGGFSVATLNSIQYGLNGSPVAGAYAYLWFLSESNGGGLRLSIRLGDAAVDFYIQSNLSSQQFYSGPESAPTIIPGIYPGPTVAFLYNPLAVPSSLSASPDTAGNLVIASPPGAPSAPFSFTITEPSGGENVLAPVITTVAGTNWHFPAESLPALNAPLGQIPGVAVDGAGNLYATDSSNSIVDQISADGTLTVVAGNGIPGFSGDGGAATSASLNKGVGVPGAGFSATGLLGVALDLFGNLYIADTLNSRIRKVSDGIITTVAGNGTSGFSGDGGPAINASLNSPCGVAVDSSGNLYIADGGNFRVRKVSGGIITTVAGNGNLSSSGDGGLATNASIVPQAIAVDSSGALYVTDFSTRIRKISQGVITTVAGNGNLGFSGDGGPATSASLSNPQGVAVDLFGNLYIADTNNYRVRKVSGGIITTIAGIGNPGFSGDDGPATSATLNTPYDVAVDALGNLYISDVALNGSRIRKVSGGVISTIAGNGRIYSSGDGGPAAAASLFNPRAIATDSAGSLYIADYDNSRVRKVAGGLITTVAGNGTYYGPAGDGGLATSATLTPTSVAVDLSDELYVGDQSNLSIRKVSAGIITTVAGDGASGFSGDGGPATSASLGIPEGVALDSSRSLYIGDQFNNRIRKVSNGIITTVAGNGTAGFSGDGGPASNASLNSPFGVAEDSMGNLYIADSMNSRVRRVSGGMITTVAGNGTFGFSGDGGPATSAALNDPFGVAVDSAGNLYIADTGNNRVRKVSDGTITTVAGNGAAGFSGDGGPAASASLNFPTGVAVDSNDDLYISDNGNSRVRVVLGNAPSFSAPATSGKLTLAGFSGGKAATASLDVAPSGVAAGSMQVSGMAYTAQVSKGSAWLSASPQSGSSPGLVTVQADPFSLVPGTYQDEIRITVANANPPVQTVNVQFTVGQAVPASIVVDHDHLSFTYANTSAARSQTITVSNQGGGSLPFSASIALDSGHAAKWLSVTPAEGTATPSTPVVLNIRADPSSLPPGTYTGHITITGTTPGTGSVSIPVAMTITTDPLILLLSQTGLTFTAVQNGGAIPAQTFGVLNLGSGVLNWTVKTSTLAGGGWLLATPDSGSSDAASTTAVPLVTVSVNPAGLQSGVYYGLVKVLSQRAANTPQEVVVVLQVLQAGTDVAPIVQPTSLVFTGTVGDSSPGSQNVLVYDPTGTNKSFRSGQTTVSGGNWFVTLPGNATIAPNEPTQIVVQPLVNNLGPGTYQGTLTLQFSDGRVSTVGITFVVQATGAGTGSVGTLAARNRAADSSSGGNCTPTKLLPALISLGTGFTVPAGYPQGLEAEVVDDCGTPHVNGTVFVQFTNGDPPVKLSSLNNGRWDGTWQTSTQPVSQVTLTVTAQDPALQIKGEADVMGALGTTEQPPAIRNGGVVSAVSLMPQVPLAPGGLISILGQRLSNGTTTAPSGPLPQELGSTIVTIGDIPLPLSYASSSKVNAQVPYEVSANINQMLLVQRGLTYATPVYVDVAAAQPAVFQSEHQPIITDMKGKLIGPSNPAHAGDGIVIQCAGLGAVNPPVADGAVTPQSPPSKTVNPVTVTIGGKNATVQSAGLTPDHTGVYQVNATVPQGVSPGDQVPLVIAAGGQTGAPVNTSVH